MRRKCVLITGAGGFIGSACAEEFVRRSWDVYMMFRRNRPGVSGCARCLQADITDAGRMREIFAAFGPFDAVAHCAGRASDIGRESDFRGSILRGTINIAQCVRRQGTGRLVHISTTDVYGLRDFHDAGEDQPLRNWPGNPYQKYKILAERAVVRHLEGRQRVILRPGVVWGAGDRMILPRMVRFLNQRGLVVHFGRWRGRNRWPAANVRNVARAAYLSAVMEQAAGQVINVVDPVRVTMDEYWRRIVGAVAGAPSSDRSICLPYAAGWLYAQASSLVGKICGLDYAPADPSVYALHMISRDLDFSSRKLQELFESAGEKFVTVEEGLAELTRQWNSGSDGGKVAIGNNKTVNGNGVGNPFGPLEAQR
ncbi:MAG: NAD(P)-dependent oxidoreductase [Planctomycetes bacterium]|nr:NAD(P)-dependent oxidoreductase [Planctomycetota bacterium]